MPLLASSSNTIKPTLAAAVFLLAMEYARATHASDFPTTTAQVLAVTGASRSQAYQMASRLREMLETLHKPAGRPCSEKLDDDRRMAIARSTIDFLTHHPAAVVIRGQHRVYSDSFRRFVVGLLGPDGLGEGLTIPDVAEAIGLPLGTIKDWLGNLPSPSVAAQQPSQSTNPNRIAQCAQPQIATLLTEYEAWEGDLSSFCEYARTQLHLPFGRSFITHVLTAAGFYHPKSRKARHQAPWSRGSLVAPFPGMQWFGDGKQVRIVYEGQTLVFNLEAFVDGASNAVVAARVTDTEDAQAVVDAFDEGLETTAGQPPMTATLDNRPSNFAPRIERTFSCTEWLHSTPKRPQAKAPVEGSFGLFAQSIPNVVVISGNTRRDIAGCILQHIVTAFYQGRNGRPRSKLHGLSPIEAYNQSPTDEQVQAAKEWILVLNRREQLARQTRERHADPVRLTLLREQIALLGIDDPQGQAALSLSRYSMAAITHGIAVFRAKQQMGTLPIDCDPYRYLGGIIRNIDTTQHLERTAQHLLQLRLRAGDLHLQPLRQRALSILTSSPSDAASKFVDAALDAPSLLAFRFWTSQATQALATMPSSSAIPLAQHLFRIIAACFAVTKAWRDILIAAVADAVAPVVA